MSLWTGYGYHDHVDCDNSTVWSPSMFNVVIMNVTKSGIVCADCITISYSII